MWSCFGSYTGYDLSGADKPPPHTCASSRHFFLTQKSAKNHWISWHCPFKISAESLRQNHESFQPWFTVEPHWPYDTEKSPLHYSLSNQCWWVDCCVWKWLCHFAGSDSSTFLGTHNMGRCWPYDLLTFIHSDEAPLPFANKTSTISWVSKSLRSNCAAIRSMAAALPPSPLEPSPATIKGTHKQRKHSVWRRRTWYAYGAKQTRHAF